MLNDLLAYRPDADPEPFIDMAMAAPWGDGLPFLPVDDTDMADALQQLGGDADSEIGDFLSHRDLCGLALLAGCTPALLPLTQAAVMAVDDQVRTAGRAAALDPEASRAVLVNGPVGSELGINSGLGLMGPGFPANAAVGRTLELTLRYCGMSHARQFGDPAQYTLAFGEDEAEDWLPLHVEAGWSRADSTVAVFTYRKAGRVFDRTSTTPEGCLERLGLFLRDYAGGTDWFKSRPLHLLVAVGQEWRRQFVAAGISKTQLRDAIFERAVDRSQPGHDPQLASADALSVVGCGGPADASVWFFVGIAGAPLIRPIPTMKEHIS